MDKPVQILLVDDHRMFIDGLVALFAKERSIRFIGVAQSAREALSFLEDHTVDLMITDISMPGGDGIELTREVKRKYPQVKILVLTMHTEKSVIAEILLAEAEGYIVKNAGRQELLKAITDIAQGNTHFCNEVVNILLGRVKRQHQQDEETKQLTDREREILSLVVQEFSTVQIADRLSISPRTVDTHRIHIMEKTRSKTLVGLIKFAFRNGLAS